LVSQIVYTDAIQMH